MGDGWERVRASDYQGLVFFDRRPASQRSRPPLQLRVSPPREPVFTSLPLTQEPRTEPALVQGELYGVLTAPNFKAFATAAAAAEQRLEALGVFEPGSVALYLERPPKLLVEDENSRAPPVLVFEAVERDVLRLEAKPTATVHGLNVGAAEVGYECSGLLRHALGRGELLSGRYYSANGAPPEVQFSASAPAHLPVRWLQPNTWLNFNRSNTDNRGTVPVFVSLEGAREETSHRLTSSFTAEQVVSRLRVSGGSTSSTSGRHGVCLEASHRDVLPLPAWALGGTLDPVVGSERNQASSLFGSNMLGSNFLNSSPLSSQNSSSSRGSRSSSSTTREWAGYGAGHWPIDSWPAGLAGKDRASKELSPLGSLASAEVLAAKPSTKVSASYSWRRDGLATFQATPSPPAPVSSSSASSSFPSHDAAAAAAAALSDGASEVQQAPGAVAVSGASFATFAEFAGAGLVHALLAPYTTTAALAQRYAPGGKSTSAGGDSRSISNDSNTTSRKSDKSSLGGDVAHFIKLAAAGRWAFPLTGAYEYTLPAPPSPETAAVAANLRAEHVVDEVAGSGSGAKRGAAAGAVLNLSLDLGWLCPLSSSPFHDLAVPTTASATGQATSASTEKGPQRSSHLVDRFFLGGPTRASALLAPPSNGSSSGGGMSSVFTPPAHLGLRGFAVGGCGPRAAAAPLSSPLGGGEASSSNDGEDDDKPGTKNGGAFGGFRNNNNNNSSSSNGPVFRNALGGDLRCAVAAELSVPAPLPTLAAAGVRGSASVQAGLLAPCANLWNSTHSSGGSVLNGTSLNASASIGVGIPLGAGAGVEVLCSKPITWSAQDRPERWQLAIGLGIGS